MNGNLVGNIYGMSSFRSDPLPIRLPLAILVPDWLISKKSSPLKPLGQRKRILVGNILGKSSIRIADLVPIR
jgi:hypothetical protein